MSEVARNRRQAGCGANRREKIQRLFCMMEWHFLVHFKVTAVPPWNAAGGDRFHLRFIDLHCFWSTGD